MSLTFAELFANPDHFLFAFEGDVALFRPMDRSAYRRSIFLDGRISAAGEGVLCIPTGQLIDAAPAGSLPPINWIFHIAHCGSTLLSRALDGAGEALVLREPAALRQLAVAHADVPRWREALRTVLALLGRRYGAAAPVVKANVPVNFILPDLLVLQPEAKGVLLHFGLEDYLLAILRSEEHRAWLRLVTGEMGIAGNDDAERAAALWLAQIRAYDAALTANPRLRSLDAALLLAEPEPAITATADYFGIALSGDLGGLLTANSKRPGERFSPQDRAARQEALRASLAGELKMARRSIAAEASGLPARLASPLVEGGKPLID